MRIVNIAIACFYIEGWAYQENILPKYHKKAGHEVFIISSRFNKDRHNKPCLRDSGEYINGDGIPVTILDYAKVNWWQKLIRAKPVVGLYEKLHQIKPDIIFVHGGQTIAVFDIIEYKKTFPSVKVFADQHGDYYNMPIVNCSLGVKVFNKYIAKHYVYSLAKYVETYWGVTPWRVDYLRNVYGLKKTKTDLLVMGGDDELIDLKCQAAIRKRLRECVGLNEDDFVIIAGGKIDKTKNIHLLMRAVDKISDFKVKLIVFGTPNDDVRAEFEALIEKNSNIKGVGWLKDNQVCDWFLASDLAVFPGTHSTLWEQAVACGIPAVFKSWEGMSHIDIGGNCVFLTKNSQNEIEETLQKIIYDKDFYIRMKTVALSENRKGFLYSIIAEKSIRIG